MSPPPPRTLSKGAQDTPACVSFARMHSPDRARLDDGLGDVGFAPRGPVPRQESGVH